MPRLEVDQRSIGFTVLGFKSSRTRMRNAAIVATTLSGQEVLARVRQTVSVPAIGGSPDSHSAALAALGHPYAKARGSIGLVPKARVSGFTRPELQVHTVSGDLLRSIRGAPIGGGDIGYQIRSDPSIAPHFEYVVRGTSVMLPRDILAATLFDPTTIKAVRKIVVFVLGQVFRTQARIRFD